jgi:hypothetical protein
MASAAQAPTDEAVLRHFKTVLWPQSYREHNVKLLDSLLAESYVVIRGDGRRSTKADEIAYLKLKKPFYAHFEFDITRVEIYGNAALVIGQGITEREDEKGEHKTRYWSTNVFEKRNGRWRAVASHTSLPQPD